MKAIRLLMFVIFSIVGSCCGAGAQGGIHYSPKTIYVRFGDDAGYSVVERQIISPTVRNDITLGALTSFGWWSRVHTVPDERLQELRRNAERNLGRKIPDPSAEFHFHLYNKSDIDKAMKLLRKEEDVRKVLRIPVSRNAQAPDLRKNQSYIADTAIGINADSVYLIYNNRGAGIRICDVEYSFNKTHTDLPTITVIGAKPEDPYGDTNHGTAVMGEIVSKNDIIGTTGIASDSRMYFAAACTAPDTAYDLVAPITAAVAQFSPGDIILLEQQIEGPNYDTVLNGAASQRGLVPVEWFEPYYDAIVLAIGNNITVVEAAGNGGENLDTPAYSTDNGGHYPFLASNNSGAIMVGAGAVGNTHRSFYAALSALPFSNYGSRLDVQANGEQVTTTGYGFAYSAGGPNEYFTTTFSGTSSASPIVTGAVALLQSVFKNETGGQVLKPAQVRSALRMTGKAQRSNLFSTSATRPIGPLPNVYAAIRLNLATLAVAPVVTVPASAVGVFPNPSTGQFSVSLPSDFKNAATDITVYSITGRVLRRFTASCVTEQTINIDISDFPDDIYQLRIVNDLICQTQRLLLVH